jgi:ABC-2 type transport system ATP-binding protein
MSGKFFVAGTVHGEAVAALVQERAQHFLRLRVAALDAGHHFGAFGGGPDVGHEKWCGTLGAGALVNPGRVQAACQTFPLVEWRDRVLFISLNFPLVTHPVTMQRYGLSMSVIIEAKGLTKRYAGKTAIDDLSFQVGEGEVVGFLGPNGAGKSTTIRILTGFLAATAGTASICGHDVFRDSLNARRQIGYMPENVPLYMDMGVKEYLTYRAQLKGIKGAKVKERVDHVMDMCGLQDVRRKLIAALSKGYRQRVGLADALVHDPKLLILDEPTNGLDPNQIRQVRSLIKELGKQHTVLVSTHILSEVEMTCNRVIIIAKGIIRAQGTPRELMHNLRTAGTVHLEVQEKPGIQEALQSLAGVRTVARKTDASGYASYVLRGDANSDLREAVYEAAVSHHWKLRELSSSNPSLEDVFVELTHSDSL